MQARVVSAARGARWLAEGWRIFRAAPFAWMLLVLAYLVVTQMLALVPLVGSAAAAIGMPGFTLGFMAAARAGSRGGAPALGLLFEGFRQDPARQLILGAVYLALTMAVLGLTFLAADEAALRELLAGRRQPGEVSLDELLAPLAVFALAYTPVMLGFWFAPPLCAWHSLGVPKALFFSFFACLLNWRAFTAYVALAAAVVIAVNLLLAAVLLAGIGTPSAAQVFALMVTLLFVLLPTLFASFYASYRDVFGYDAAP